jgi:RNA polymerase sigma factor (sigma-70 family)
VSIDHSFGRQDLAALQPELVRFAQSLGLQQADAQDVAADAIERGLNNLAVLHRHGSPRGWLYTTTRNLAIDHVRALTRRRSGDLGEAEQRPSAALSVEDYVHARAEAAIALEALEHVTPRHQYVIWRHMVMGVDSATMAEELGLNQAAFRQLRQRAKRAFWAEYGRRGGSTNAGVLLIPGLQGLRKLREMLAPAVVVPAVAAITAAVLGAGAVLLLPSQPVEPELAPEAVTGSAGPAVTNQDQPRRASRPTPVPTPASLAHREPRPRPDSRPGLVGLDTRRTCFKDEQVCLEVDSPTEARYLFVRTPAAVKRLSPVPLDDAGVGSEEKEQMDPVCNNLPEQRFMFCEDRVGSGSAEPQPTPEGEPR